MTPEITPADREAAAQYFEQAGDDIRAANARLGAMDDLTTVQAFARHRIAAEQRAQEAEPGQADGDLTAAYLAGSASRNDEVRALQAEVVRLREALREVRGGVLRNILTRIDAILAGEG